MTAVQAVTVTAITGVTTSSDGEVALVRVKLKNDELTLAYPFALLIPLMQTLSEALGVCSRIRKSGQLAKHVLPVESWNIGGAPDGQHVILSLRTPEGMEMSFQVQRDQVANMKDSLSAAIGEAVAVPSGVSRQWN